MYADSVAYFSWLEKLITFPVTEIVLGPCTYEWLKCQHVCTHRQCFCSEAKHPDPILTLGSVVAIFLPICSDLGLWALVICTENQTEESSFIAFIIWIHIKYLQVLQSFLFRKYQSVHSHTYGLPYLWKIFQVLRRLSFLPCPNFTIHWLWFSICDTFFKLYPIISTFLILRL